MFFYKFVMANHVMGEREFLKQELSYDKSWFYLAAESFRDYPKGGVLFPLLGDDEAKALAEYEKLCLCKTVEEVHAFYEKFLGNCEVNQ